MRFAILSAIALLPILGLASPAPVAEAQPEPASSVASSKKSFTEFYLQTSLVKVDIPQQAVHIRR
jgi:hypothetical protein